jgi:ribosomal protein S18 acetylase RimI-like enzyme
VVVAREGAARMSAESLTVRRAEASDIEAVLELWHEFMDFHAAFGAYFGRAEDSDEEFRGWLTQRLEADRSLLLVAEIDGRTIGYLLGADADRPPVFALRRYGMIFDLAVTASHRRRGVGSALLERAMEWFEARGLERVELNVLLANERASSFWRERGFTPFLQSMFREM